MHINGTDGHDLLTVALGQLTDQHGNEGGQLLNLVRGQGVLGVALFKHVHAYTSAHFIGHICVLITIKVAFI